MKKAKLSLEKLTTLQKISKARTVAESMGLNSGTFTTPNPTLAALTAKAQEVEDAYEAAETGLNSAKVVLEEREKELDTLLTQEAAYVSNIAAGNEILINLAGMEATDEKTPPQLPDAATNVRLVDNKQVSGSFKILFNNPKKSKSLLLYVAREIETGGTTPPTPPSSPSPGSPAATILSNMPIPPPQPGTTGYILYDVCTKSGITVSGFTAGKRVWVTIVTIGAGGKSGFSDPATIIVR